MDWWSPMPVGASVRAMTMVQRIRLSVSDVFHHIVDGIIRRAGGPGNIGQLHIRLGCGFQVAAFQQAWIAWQRQCPLVQAAHQQGWRGHFFVVVSIQPRPAKVHAASMRQVAGQVLRHGLAARERLRCDIADDGVVLTWDHRLCDARGAQQVLSHLTGAIDANWTASDYRPDVRHQLRAQARGRAAQAAVALLRPLRIGSVLRPAGRCGNAAAPIAHQSTVLGEDTAIVDQRIRATVGRFGETAFCLAAVAAALTDVSPFNESDTIVFPLAADIRGAKQRRDLANAHEFMFVSVPAKVAQRNLSEAAQSIKSAHKQWVAADGSRKLMAAISYFGCAGSWFARYQVGWGKAGMAASACVANTGQSLLPATWFGAQVEGVDHVAAVPGHPGIGILFHRDQRGLGFDTIVTGVFARRCSPVTLAARIRWHLVERPLE